ncbi:Allantoicase, partial [Linderina macrospora]
MGNTHSNLPVYYNADPTNTAHLHSLSKFVDLANQSIGGTVLKASNERFGSAKNLVKTRAAVSKAERKTADNVDAWVTRRHNPETDWAIIRLGSMGTIAGFDIDTTGLDGDQAYKISIQACLASEDAEADDEGNLGVEWDELLPEVEVNADSHHLLALWTETQSAYNYVRLTLHPDGGVSRFRVFGTVALAAAVEGETDLALINNGARVVSASNEKLGAKENLILPGRSLKSQPETQGWKTARSHTTGHSEWAVVRLGEPGFLTRIEVDTHLYDGDQPVAVAVQACYTHAESPEQDTECFWYQLVPRMEVNGNELHTFQVSLNDVPFSHIKLIVHPDGGISRVRAYGQRVTEIEEEVAREEAEAAAEAEVAAEAGLDADTPAEGASTPAEPAAEDEDSAAAESVAFVVIEKTEGEAEEAVEEQQQEEVKQVIPKAPATPSPRKKSRAKHQSLAAEESSVDQFSSKAGELIE